METHHWWASIYPGTKFLKHHWRKLGAYQIGFLYCVCFVFSKSFGKSSLCCSMPKPCKRGWIRHVIFQEEKTKVLYINLSFLQMLHGASCTSNCVVNHVLSFCKGLPLWLTLLLNSKLSLSFLAWGCAHGLWQSTTKTPISESWLLSPVRKSITLQQNANLLTPQLHILSSAAPRNRGKMEFVPLEHLWIVQHLIQHWLHHLWDMGKNENGVSLIQKLRLSRCRHHIIRAMYTCPDSKCHRTKGLFILTLMHSVEW